ncbi:unnamed protein product [Caenorhabditis brenneri]
MIELLKDIIQCAALIVSIVLNTVLTYLILTKSNSKMGTYKYIMMYLSLSALSYSVLGLIVRPDLLSYSSCFAVYVKNSSSFFSADVMIYLMSFICGFYFFFASLIAVHFVYRYKALKHGSKWTYFHGKFSFRWFIISPFLYINWTLTCLLAFQPNQKSTAFLRSRMENDFGINVDEVTYIVADFYPMDGNGNISPSLTAFLSGANFLVMTMISLIVIFVYGFKCYFEMTRVVVPGRNYSLTQKLLQTQLFRALVFQTLIPLTIMYLPLFVLFLFPMFNVNVGFAHYVSISISLYPALDALPSLLLIRDYRDCLYRMIRKHETPQNVELYYVRRGSNPISSGRKSTVHLSRVELG